MSDNYTISTADRLLMRLGHAIRSEQKITFLLGSGLTCPHASINKSAIPGASEMVEKVRKLFVAPDELRALDDVLKRASERKKYQAAMRFMIECRGQSALNKLIRSAVLEARLISNQSNKSDEDLEHDLKGWHLPPAIEAFGKLMQEHESVFQKPILTSNFDPLLEIGIRRAGRGALTINLPNDGSFRGLIVSDNIAQIVHFHGFWREGDTLHTPDQLTRERPLLTGNLRKMLQETLLVVMGYGGWEDVFTESLMKAISEQSENIDILWTFFSKDHSEVTRQHETLLKAFRALPGDRVVTYCGVDCHELLPKLHQQLLRSDSTANRSHVVRITENFSKFKKYSGMSSPPTTEAWVGRGSELNALLNAQCSVLVLHGMGGFGKSSLAARYLAERIERKNLSVWCWADCREQGNTLQTHLVNMLEEITQGEITPESLQKASTQDIIDLFFERIGEHPALFVFDNIDHYVDLETQQATGVVHMVLERALTANHKSQFVFTSRPHLEYSSNRFFALPLLGLGQGDAEELFKLRGANWDLNHKAEQLELVLSLTQGSALHLNLIAMQVAKLRIPLNDLLARIEKGAAPEAEDRILSEIWGTLKDEQKDVLRYLAEIPHGEPEQWVASCLSHLLTYNRFSKAIKVLKNLNLIVAKPSNNEEIIELHPLVKAFIRKNFRKEEQSQIIEKIINFFDRMIGRFGGSRAAGPVSLLENWTGKIELCVENGRVAQAMSTLSDIYETLLIRGQSEEFLRLAELVINNYEIVDDPSEAYKFDNICEAFLSVLGQLGRYDEVDFWVEKFANTIVGKSARYIWLCNVRAYAFWLRGNFQDAKKWATEGVELKSKSQMDTLYDSRHTLALALRDSKQVEDALPRFLSGEKLELILSGSNLDSKRGGAFYGNIGRCLQFQERFDDALICLKISAQLLEEEKNRNALLNRGWAALWLGETLDKKSAYDFAYIAFRSAAAKWKNISPQRSRNASDTAQNLLEKIADSTIPIAGDWEIEQMYLNWLKHGKI